MLVKPYDPQKLDDQQAPHYLALGSPYLQVFERTLSQIFEKRAVIGMKGRIGFLVLALKSIGVMKGDEVIMPAFCAPLNVIAVRRAGAIPIFVDIRLSDYAIDPGKIEECISYRTKAILVPHLFGKPATMMREIMVLSKANAVPVVENISQAFLAKIRMDGDEKYTGMLGDIGCMGFLWGDDNSDGIGCLIFQEESLIYQNALKRRAKGKGFILSERQLSYFFLKYKNFESQLKSRNDQAAYYREQLSGVGDIVLPEVNEGNQPSWYRFVIRTDRASDLRIFLRDRGVVSDSLDKYFLVDSRGGNRPDDFPMSLRAMSETVSLPIFGASDANVISTVQWVKHFFWNKI